MKGHFFLFLSSTYEFLRRANRPATVVSIAAFVLLILMVFLMRVTDLFNEKNIFFYLIDKIFIPVFQSIVASYIFYLMVVHLKEERQRKQMSPYIFRQMEFLIFYCERQLSDIAENTRVDLTLGDLSLDDLRLAFSKIHIKDSVRSKFCKKNANWEDFFKMYKVRASMYEDNILKINYIGVEEYMLVCKIIESNHMRHGHMLREHIWRESSIESYAKNFFNYCMRCRELQIYLQVNGCE